MKFATKLASVLILLIAVFTLRTTPVFAHDASLTYTSIVISDKQIDLTMTTPYNNILKNVQDPHAFEHIFARGFIILNDEQSCQPKLTSVKQMSDIKSFQYHFRVTCPTHIDKIRFVYKLFFDVSPTHENITDVHVGNDTKQLIFSSTKHILDIDYQQVIAEKESSQAVTTILTFLKIGILHILTGYDHMLFLLGLLVVTKKFKNLLKIVTSFTLAHSVTLSIAALGIFLLPSRFTESMIALSIAYVAVEDVLIVRKSDKKTWYSRFFLADIAKRWIVALLFGLVHGFGFSSALREIGIPSNELVVSLVSFNVGVEIGQLLIISAVSPLLWLIRKKGYETKTIQIVSIIICAFGLLWFFQRAFFA